MAPDLVPPTRRTISTHQRTLVVRSLKVTWKRSCASSDDEDQLGQHPTRAYSKDERPVAAFPPQRPGVCVPSSGSIGNPSACRASRANRYGLQARQIS
jgi:hypothetical protein